MIARDLLAHRPMELRPFFRATIAFSCCVIFAGSVGQVRGAITPEIGRITITSVDLPLQGAFMAGDVFTVHISYDDAVVDTQDKSSFPDLGRFQNAVIAGSTISRANTNLGTWDPSTGISIPRPINTTDGTGVSGVDELTFAVEGSTFPSVGNYDLDDLVVTLSGPGSLFTDGGAGQTLGSLLATQINNIGWASQQAEFLFFDGRFLAIASGSFTFVPEPRLAVMMATLVASVLASVRCNSTKNA